MQHDIVIKKAHRVSGIFDTLAGVVLVLGGLAGVVLGIGLVMALVDGEGAGVFGVAAAVVAINFGLVWAVLSLASLVAEYIAIRVPGLDRTTPIEQ